MINNFEIIIGIETHVVLNTKTKMFSSSRNAHNFPPNTLVNEIDLGLPGILPSPNPMAIKKAIWLGKVLNSEINYGNIQFDRKNYFYLDLPKGYQITQQYFPIGTNGYLPIIVDGQIKNIEIERFHLEEDTAKQISKDNTILLDYNRSGAPLLEIVTKPVITSALEASEYLKKLILLLKFNNISDAKLEDGSMRADINISVRPYGQDKFNNKVEIKNINSINNVVSAINYEIDRQIKEMLSNNVVLQQTRRFDESTNSTVFMREKTNAVNYHYFHEANILTIKLTDDEYNKIIAEKNKDLDVIIDELKSMSLNEAAINLLINDYELYKLFNYINSQTKDPIICFNWITVELQGLLRKNNSNINKLTDKFINEFIKMLNLLIDQDINGKQAKTLLEELYNNPIDVNFLIDKLGFVQIKDPIYLNQLIKQIINDNQNIVEEYPTRPEKVQKFIVGQVMKETKSQANPKITMEIVLKLLCNN